MQVLETMKPYLNPSFYSYRVQVLTLLERIGLYDYALHCREWKLIDCSKRQQLPVDQCAFRLMISRSISND